MSMDSIKKIIKDNPGILQCDLINQVEYNGSQITKLVKRKEIIRIRATKNHKGNTYRLYLPEVMKET